MVDWNREYSVFVQRQSQIQNNFYNRPFIHILYLNFSQRTNFDSFICLCPKTFFTMIRLTNGSFQKELEVFILRDQYHYYTNIIGIVTETMDYNKSGDVLPDNIDQVNLSY